MMSDQAQGTATKAIDLKVLTELVARTIEVFGTATDAVRWLETTNPALDGQTPLAVYQADGAQRVAEVLLAIEHGIAA